MEGSVLWNASGPKALHVSCPVLSGVVFGSEVIRFRFFRSGVLCQNALQYTSFMPKNN